MRIGERFCGFPGHVLGGYAAGLLARAVDAPAVEVRLERPIRIGDDVVVDADALVRDGERVATARAVTLDLRPPRVVTRQDAERASAGYPGATHHFFPGCFCCGPARARGDGLRIFVGALGGGLVAAPWRPADAIGDDLVPDEILWSALDCPGIWAEVLATSGTGEKAVSGSLAVGCAVPLRATETHIVVAWPIAREGRRIVAGAAVLDERGAILAVARHTLVTTERGVPLDREAWSAAPMP